MSQQLFELILGLIEGITFFLRDLVVRDITLAYFIQFSPAKLAKSISRRRFDVAAVPASRRPANSVEPRRNCRWWSD